MTEEMLELLRLLEQHGVRYLVIGGVAVNLHGYSRNTKDIDIWIADNEANRLATYIALEEYFGGAPIEKGYFLSHQGVFVFGLVPNRVDLLTEASGPSFESLFATRLRIERKGVEFNVVDGAGLIALKRAANRPQDRMDIRALRKFALQSNQDDSAEED